MGHVGCVGLLRDSSRCESIGVRIPNADFGLRNRGAVGHRFRIPKSALRIAPSIRDTLFGTQSTHSLLLQHGEADVPDAGFCAGDKHRFHETEVDGAIGANADLERPLGVLALVDQSGIEFGRRGGSGA